VESPKKFGGIMFNQPNFLTPRRKKFNANNKELMEEPERGLNKN